MAIILQVIFSITFSWWKRFEFELQFHTSLYLYCGLKYKYIGYTWWRHQMETFFAWLAICAGNSLVPGEFPAQRPVMRSFDIFFDLRLNKRLSKQSWCWWFETLSCPLWHHCNVSFNPTCQAENDIDMLMHVAFFRTALYIIAIKFCSKHYSDGNISAMAPQITAVPIVCSTVCSGAGQRKHQSSASLAFVRATIGDMWIPLTKGQERAKCFHLMTSL